MQYIKTEKLTQKMQVLCGLQGIFLIFNCQTPGKVQDAARDLKAFLDSHSMGNL